MYYTPTYGGESQADMQVGIHWCPSDQVRHSAVAGQEGLHGVYHCMLQVGREGGRSGGGGGGGGGGVTN